MPGEDDGSARGAGKSRDDILHPHGTDGRPRREIVLGHGAFMQLQLSQDIRLELVYGSRSWRPRSELYGFPRILQGTLAVEVLRGGAQGRQQHQDADFRVTHMYPRAKL